jgi:hypothetical protein
MCRKRCSYACVSSGSAEFTVKAFRVVKVRKRTQLFLKTVTWSLHEQWEMLQELWMKHLHNIIPYSRLLSKDESGKDALTDGAAGVVLP